MKKSWERLFNGFYDKAACILSKLYRYNKSLRHIPGIVFVCLYIFSGVDLVPEAAWQSWPAYADDTIAIIFLLVYFYCNGKGVIKEHDTVTFEEKSAYSHIIRNSGQQHHHSDGGENTGATDERADPTDRHTVRDGADSKLSKPHGLNASELFETIRRAESEYTTEEHGTDGRGKCSKSSKSAGSDTERGTGREEDTPDYSDDYARDFEGDSAYGLSQAGFRSIEDIAAANPCGNNVGIDGTANDATSILW